MMHGGLPSSSIGQAHPSGFAGRELATVLWVSGVLTLIVWLYPQSIVWGTFLGILPGVILALSPLVFFCTATFAIVRRLLPITHAFTHNLVAAFITLGLGVLAWASGVLG